MNRQGLGQPGQGRVVKGTVEAAGAHVEAHVEERCLGHCFLCQYCYFRILVIRLSS